MLDMDGVLVITPPTMRVWVSKPADRITYGVDVHSLMVGADDADKIAPVLTAILFDIGEVLIETRDYGRTVGVMNPATKQAVYITRSCPRYFATIELVPSILEHLKTPRGGNEDAVIEEALITREGKEFPGG